MTLDHDAVRARCDAATLGPWWSLPIDDGGSYLCRNPHVSGTGLAEIDRDADATFIAHARTDVPALLDELAALRGARALALDDLQSAADRITALTAEVQRLKGDVGKWRDAASAACNLQNNVAAVLGVDTDWNDAGRKAVVDATCRTVGNLADAQQQVAALTAERDAARARVEKLEAEIAWRVEMSRKAMVGQDKLSDGLVNHIDELRAENKRAAAIIADYIDDVARLQAKVAELEAAAGLPGSCICDDDGPDEPLCAPCYVETLARQANVQGRRADAAEADNARLRAELTEARAVRPCCDDHAVPAACGEPLPNAAVPLSCDRPAGHPDAHRSGVINWTAPAPAGVGDEEGQA